MGFGSKGLGLRFLGSGLSWKKSLNPLGPRCTPFNTGSWGQGFRAGGVQMSCSRNSSKGFMYGIK